MAKKLIMVGAISVGKGFAMGMLGEAFPSLPRIILGEYFRDLCSQDESFATTYGPVMKRGHLLPDEVVIPHGTKLITPMEENKVIALDGVCRTANQVFAMKKHNNLGKGDTVCIMHASKKTCHDRHQDRIRRKPNGNRGDEAWFIERYDLFRHELPFVVSAVSEVGATIRHIDANVDLQSIALEVVTYAMHMTGDEPNLKIFGK